MRQVRAKFRVLSVTKKWDHMVSVELGPVLQRGSNPENAAFWKFTPSGDCTLVFWGPALDNRGEEYHYGDYYYIDMHPDQEEGGWCLSKVTHCGEESGDVEFATNGRYTADHGEKGFRYGKLGMGLDHAPALKWFDNPGKYWSVEFTWAEESDD